MPHLPFSVQSSTNSFLTLVHVALAPLQTPQRSISAPEPISWSQPTGCKDRTWVYMMKLELLDICFLLSHGNITFFLCWPGDKDPFTLLDTAHGVWLYVLWHVIKWSWKASALCTTEYTTCICIHTHLKPRVYTRPSKWQGGYCTVYHSKALYSKYIFKR